MNFERLPLIVTDGFEFYQKVIRRFFGPACLYGQVLKTRRNESSSTHGKPQIWGLSEAMSAIRVPRTYRENTVQQRDATLPGGDLDPGTGRTWTRTC